MAVTHGPLNEKSTAKLTTPNPKISLSWDDNLLAVVAATDAAADLDQHRLVADNQVDMDFDKDRLVPVDTGGMFDLLNKPTDTPYWD